MTTGKRFQYCGQSPSERINRLQKEVELLEQEIHGHREENLHLNRPVRHPPEQEARLCLARDLCRSAWMAHGYDHAKFIRMLQLPLFQVALGGQASMLEVYAQALALARSAA